MIRINQMPLGLDEEESSLVPKISKLLRLDAKYIREVRIVKKAVDARKKEAIHFVYGLDAVLDLSKVQENKILEKTKNPNLSITVNKKYEMPVVERMPKQRPIVVGAGPAGLLAALLLAEAGLKPLVIERGQEVEKRRAAVDLFWQTGKLDPKSNVQFGQGGAGAFSDGKLTTNTKDMRNFKVLNEFVEAGAPPEILYLAKPHIGTDLLIQVVDNLSKKIIALGGEIRFNTQLVNLVLVKEQVVAAVVEDTLEAQTETQTETQIGNTMEIPTSAVILAIGHSARDSFEFLHKLGVPMTQKSFSLGVRIEHLQAEIDQMRYGSFAGHPALGPADYKLFAHLPGGRSVYTFCMCPGGSVVAAASELGGVVTNGMSKHARAAVNANSALLVGVDPSDFGSDHPLAGMYLQRKIEAAAFAQAGSNYKAPCQLVGDFLANRPSTAFGKVLPSYLPGVALGEVGSCLPDFVVDALKAGLPELAKKLKCFGDEEAILTGPETRSSSPIRIDRNENYQSFAGLYPCGEGAGYAGGIISAAVDGIRCAEAVIKNAAN